MTIDENKEFSLSTFSRSKGKPIVKHSDHNTLILDFITKNLKGLNYTTTEINQTYQTLRIK